MSYTKEQLLERAAFIDKQIVVWKGNPQYADTMRMEAWALRTAAGLVEVPSDTLVDQAAKIIHSGAFGEDSSEHQRHEAREKAKRVMALSLCKCGMEN